jgi:hypothetical protein
LPTSSRQTPKSNEPAPYRLWQWDHFDLDSGKYRSASLEYTPRPDDRCDITIDGDGKQLTIRVSVDELAEIAAKLGVIAPRLKAEAIKPKD